MIAAIPYPNIDPVMLEIGPIAIRWYGLAYVAGFIVAGLVTRSLIRRWKVALTDDDLLDMVLVAVIGLVAGARIGYVVFYGVGAYWDDPLSILAFWDGGMSFHGGLIGIMLAGWLVARRKGIPVLQMFDLGAVGAPLGIFFGRVANFINGELWGRTTDVPWGMVFPRAPGDLPRHPSQLYEAVLEGLVIFCVLWVLSRRKRGDGLIVGTLLLLYAVFRTGIEFFREPDAQLGFIFGSLTMGQLLTLPLVFAGGWLVWRALAFGRAEAGDTP
ncbi:MAG: prolipoprotein diacylglyceryl transferase [Coriobacteriia bacterium]|nr:prolipoprotein diacylglyceryl transferase [Coriobacteriia bacterium]